MRGQAENKLAATWAQKMRAISGESNKPKLLDDAALIGAELPAHTLSPRRVNKRKLALLMEQNANEVHEERPKTRGECLSMERPCPYVSCKHHLYLDVRRNGTIALNFPDLEPWELIDTCALDVAEETELGDPTRPSGNGEGDGVTMERVGLILNMTRERVRQIEERALETLQKKALVLREFADGCGVVRGNRVLPVLNQNELDDDTEDNDNEW